MHNHDNNPLEYNQITEYIYLGTNACCSDHFREELLEKGITADISLEQERLDAPYGIDIFLWLPTIDHTPPSPAQVKTGVDAIASLIASKQTTYIHCKNGHGRAPTLLAAYFISTGMSVEDAISRIKEKRSSIHLEPSQKEALEQYKKECCPQ